MIPSRRPLRWLLLAAGLLLAASAAACSGGLGSSCQSSRQCADGLVCLESLDAMHVPVGFCGPIGGGDLGVFGPADFAGPSAGD